MKMKLMLEHHNTMDDIYLFDERKTHAENEYIYMCCPRNGLSKMRNKFEYDSSQNPAVTFIVQFRCHSFRHMLYTFFLFRVGFFLILYFVSS